MQLFRFILSIWHLFAATALCVCVAAPAVAGERVTYLVLAETVEPIMIVRNGDPMAGGLMTEIVKLIFADSSYDVEPLVLPWQRMQAEFETSDNWIINGFPESFSPEAHAEFSEYPIFPFNHSAVTLKDRDIDISTISDLDNRTIILVENFQYPVLDDYIELSASGESNSNVSVVRAFKPSGTLDMLRHKRGDMVIDWQARLIYNLNAAGLRFEDVIFHDATNIVPTKNLHLAFSSRQSDEFRTFVNDRIKMLTESGQLYELTNKYYAPAKPPAF